MPYLVVRYELTKPDTGQTLKGELMPMVANDGPHYGENLKLMGVGKYKLTLTILPPSGNEHVHFGRHVDKNGVASSLSRSQSTSTSSLQERERRVRID